MASQEEDIEAYLADKKKAKPGTLGELMDEDLRDQLGLEDDKDKPKQGSA